MWWQTAISILTDYGVWAIPLVVCAYLLWVISNEERTNRFRARLFKLFHHVSHSTRAEKKYIQYDVASKLSTARRKMPFGRAQLPRTLRVCWVEQGEGQSTLLGENELIVRLDPIEDQEKNVVLLTQALVRRTALVGLRHIVTGPLEEALDLNLVRVLLECIGSRAVLDWYLRQEVQPSLRGFAEIREWSEKLLSMDRRGLFTRLLLVEMDSLARSLPTTEDATYVEAEIRGLVNFIHRIATKPASKDVPLGFMSRHVRIGVVLVGKSWKVAHLGTRPYIGSVAKYIRMQVGAVYVLELPRSTLGVKDPQTYQKVLETLEDLPKQVADRFEVNKDFSLEFTSLDERGRREQLRIHRYITGYSP